MENENMKLYHKRANVPAKFLKEIKAGKLKGYSDINPQWRIQALTESFGPVGIGWTAKMTEHWSELAGDEILCFVNVEMRINQDGEWSEPFTGTGGSGLLSKSRNGLYSSDEGYKMAYTDAISVCCKMLGIASNVYLNCNDSKYSTRQDPEQEPKKYVFPKSVTERSGDVVAYFVKCGMLKEGQTLQDLTDKVKQGIVERPHDLLKKLNKSEEQNENHKQK